jgi:hypothetical protein
VEAAMKPRLKAKASGPSALAWMRYYLGRFLQVVGLMLTLVAMTAFFGSPSTVAMLRMMLIGVLFFIPGWLLSRKDPSHE